jgi:hypothetical protein
MGIYMAVAIEFAAMVWFWTMAIWRNVLAVAMSLFLLTLGTFCVSRPRSVQKLALRIYENPLLGFGVPTSFKAFVASRFYVVVIVFVGVAALVMGSIVALAMVWQLRA